MVKGARKRKQKTKASAKEYKHKRAKRGDGKGKLDQMFGTGYVVFLSIFFVIAFGFCLYFLQSGRFTYALWTGVASGIFAILGIACYIQANVVNPLVWREKNPPFSIAVEVVFGMETRTLQSHFLATFGSPTVPLASPVHRLLFLRVENRQDFPSMIASYVVEAQQGDKWIKLNRIDSRFASLYWVNNDLHKAIRIDLSKNGFDSMIADKAIPPHEPIRGWSLFELPEDVSIHSSYRIHVRDTEGAETVQIMSDEKAPNPDTDSLLGGCFELAETADISGRRLVYWSEANQRR